MRRYASPDFGLQQALHELAGGRIADCDAAIRINPALAEAYNNRGNAKAAVPGRGGMGDSIVPKIAPAKAELGRNQDALADYDKT